MIKENDLKILSSAKKAKIAVVFEEQFVNKRLNIIKRIFNFKSKIGFPPEIELHPDIISIRFLTEHGFLQKENSEEMTYIQEIGENDKVKKRVRKDVYKITEKGLEVVRDLIKNEENNKVLNMKDFKNNNCPF